MCVVIQLVHLQQQHSSICLYSPGIFLPYLFIKPSVFICVCATQKCKKVEGRSNKVCCNLCTTHFARSGYNAGAPLDAEFLRIDQCKS